MYDYCRTTKYVFPAPAGVILRESLSANVEAGFPRTCGGDPGYGNLDSYGAWVFPAPAGVILTRPAIY